MSSTDASRPRRRRVRRWCSAAVVLWVAGACHTDLGPFILREWGLITLDHQSVNGDDYTRPQALFYRSLSSPTLSGRGAADVCGRFQYPSVSTADSIDEIPAGESVTLSLQDAEYALTPTTVGSRRPYSMPAPGILYRPGDSVVVEIPGAPDGFPAMTIRGRTAEPFALGPIDTTLAASDEVTWTPPGDDSSRMVVSMQYRDESSSGTGVNAQVFCTFRDDGVGVIPETLLREWATSTGGRRVQAVRWRSAMQAAGDAVLYFVSTYTVTKTSFP